jgi:hypothetical protein
MRGQQKGVASSSWHRFQPVLLAPRSAGLSRVAAGSPRRPHTTPSFRTEQADFSSRFTLVKRSACGERNLSSLQPSNIPTFQRSAITIPSPQTAPPPPVIPNPVAFLANGGEGSASFRPSAICQTFNLQTLQPSERSPRISGTASASPDFR